MTIEYRQITAAEQRSFFTVISRGFGGSYEPSAELYRNDRLTLTPEMTMAAFDGDEIVGTSGGHPFESAVPGGAIIKNAGVTAVTVSGTHRRQGLLNGMMQRLLRQEREKGQPVALALGIGKHHLRPLWLRDVDSTREFPYRHP
jgi:predicted N-acetyltransferase YhbS